MFRRYFLSVSGLPFCPLHAAPSAEQRFAVPVSPPHFFFRGSAFSVLSVNQLKVTYTVSYVLFQKFSRFAFILKSALYFELIFVKAVRFVSSLLFWVFCLFLCLAYECPVVPGPFI